MWQLVRPDMLFEILLWIQRRPGLKHDHTETAFGKNFRGGAAGGAGADDANVVNFGRAGHLGHEFFSSSVVGRRSLALTRTDPPTSNPTGKHCNHASEI